MSTVQMTKTKGHASAFEGEVHDKKPAEAAKLSPGSWNRMLVAEKSLVAGLREGLSKTAQSVQELMTSGRDRDEFFDLDDCYSRGHHKAHAAHLVPFPSAHASMSPTCKWRTGWDTCMLCLVLFVLLVTPFELAFVKRSVERWELFFVRIDRSRRSW